MQDYNIQVINFDPVPYSTLISYFNSRLNELAQNPRVTAIKSAKLLIMYRRPPINAPVEYLFSAEIPGKSAPTYHTVEIVISIFNGTNHVDCTISNYEEVYFEKAIDTVINEALSRCHRYF
jgi:hypothetical protein